MRRLTRWKAGIFSHFDSFASRIENHDGLIAAAVREAQDARARARVQLARVHRDGERMAQRLDELRGAEESWSGRALRTAHDDEARALECLRRRKRAHRERVELEKQLASHAKTEAQLRADLERVDERIERLKQQRNLLRTRQSRAEALAATQCEDGTVDPEIDDILERWEIKITSTETRTDCHSPLVDDLESEFIGDEEADELRAELAALIVQADPQAAISQEPLDSHPTQEKE
jgi:phage shock protein A